jgi:hypothetical protein
MREKFVIVFPTTEVWPGCSVVVLPELMLIAADPQPKTVLEEAVLLEPSKLRQTLPALLTTQLSTVTFMLFVTRTATSRLVLIVISLKL